MRLDPWSHSGLRSPEFVSPTDQKEQGDLRETAWDSSGFMRAFEEFERDHDRTDDHGGYMDEQKLLSDHRQALLRGAEGHPLYKELEQALSGKLITPVFEACYKIRDYYTRDSQEAIAAK